MDPRAHITFNKKSSYILPEKVADFFVNPEAFKAFLETLDIANSNASVTTQARQMEIQKAMLAENLAAEATKNSWKPRALPPTEWFMMAPQQQQGSAAILPRKEAEAIRRDQFARQNALLAQARLTP